MVIVCIMSRKLLKIRKIITTDLRGLITFEDGTCRTLKSQYFKTGRINFQYQNDWGATGVMVIYETD